MKPIVDLDLLYAWSLEHDECASCWTGGRDTFALHTHHIVKRSRLRVDRPFNFLRLCFQCHGAAEGERIVIEERGRALMLPQLTLAHCMTLKAEANPDEWDRELLQAARGWALPEPKPLPDYYMQRRRQRGRLLMTIKEIDEQAAEAEKGK